MTLTRTADRCGLAGRRQPNRPLPIARAWIDADRVPSAAEASARDRVRPDKALYIAESGTNIGGNAIGRFLTTTGELKQFFLPAGAGGPWGSRWA
jgi:hypothetical protein